MVKRNLRQSLCCSAVLLGTVGCGLLLSGCEKPLFPSNMPRTQYERYDKLRGRYVPAEQMNAYGGTEPALRDRLTPPRD